MVTAVSWYFIFLLLQFRSFTIATAGNFNGDDEELYMNIHHNQDDFMEPLKNNDMNPVLPPGVSTVLEELIPVRSTIVPGGRHVYEFPVEVIANVSLFYDTLTFISGNICSMPAGSSAQKLRLYYSFDENVLSDLSIAEPADFDEGYVEALAVSPRNATLENPNAFSRVFLVLQLVYKSTGLPVEASEGSVPWVYEICASQNMLAYQWDGKPRLNVIDVDSDSALLTNEHFTAKADNDGNRFHLSSFDLLLYSGEHIEDFNVLSKSVCAISTGPLLTSSKNFIGDAENSTMSSTDLKITKSFTKRNGMLKEQFHITGLNRSSTYVAYLKQYVIDNHNDTSSGGVIFSKKVFSTMANDACSLIFGLNFCSGVSYSVPSSSVIRKDDKASLAKLYDDMALSLYANFSLALQLSTCEGEADAIYSPLRTCADCANSYKNWLCAVTIPRCTTINTSYYTFREKDNGRSDFINEVVQPAADYYEIQPCIEMCHSIVRDCPAEFGFVCPTDGKNKDLLFKSYNIWDDDIEFDTCNLIGDRFI
ncbi:HDL415Cp [Eremothecium sinecaudum]|uniref:HDL415Cp n=1 Tax=Eremothecium sinecaudum TaxID=45286 RepID=A0A0X8HRW5_9SACH|nr:HDL415Cp [Eremothecium sinecaudum]AMD20329.1 HDL415Cp [Eremothecium sinecaudum]